MSLTVDVYVKVNYIPSAGGAGAGGPKSQEQDPLSTAGGALSDSVGSPLHARTPDVPRHLPALFREGGHALPHEVGGRGHRAARAVAQGRRAGPSRHDHARAVRRRRRRLPLQRHPDRGAGPRTRLGSGLLAAQRHRRALPAALRQRRAEEEVDPQGLLGRAGHGHRHDRARHRLGPAGGQDQRGDGRQSLGDQRLEDLHQQRPARRPGDRRRQDRSQARRQGHLADRGRDQDAKASSAAAISRRSA